MNDDELQAAADRANARIALDVLKRRHPEWDWDPPCPDCGSRDHFECGERTAPVERVTITLATASDQANISPNGVRNIFTAGCTISIGRVGEDGRQITDQSKKSRNSD